MIPYRNQRDFICQNLEESQKIFIENQNVKNFDEWVQPSPLLAFPPNKPVDNEIIDLEEESTLNVDETVENEYEKGEDQLTHLEKDSQEELDTDLAEDIDFTEWKLETNNTDTFWDDYFQQKANETNQDDSTESIETNQEFSDGKKELKQREFIIFENLSPFILDIK